MISGNAVHQGIIAFAAVKEYSTVEDILEYAQNKNEAPFIIILDEVEDPHNLGAIIRTAECAGVHGIIIPKRRSASLSYTVGKASAGAVEYMRIARVTNIAKTIDELKEKKYLGLRSRYERHRLQRLRFFRFMRNCYRQRRKRNFTTCKRKMRCDSFFTNERKNQLAQCICCRGHFDVQSNERQINRKECINLAE